MKIPILLKTYKWIQLYRARILNIRKNTQDFVITGIPRSGTSLLSFLLNKTEGCVVFNEIHYNANTLPLFFRRRHKKLVGGRPIPNKFNEKGELTTDTLDRKKVSVRKKNIPTRGDNLALGSKVNIPYLKQINTILGHGYKVIAVVRNPVYTLGSWNSKKVANIPIAHVVDSDMHPRWRDINFVSDDKFERHAQIWEHYASLI